MSGHCMFESNDDTFDVNKVIKKITKFLRLYKK